MEKTCIICRQKKYEKPSKPEQFEEDKQKESEFDLEHIIPKAIGGNITFREVCKDCNGKLKDSYLTDHPVVSLLRYINDLKGQKGKSVDPFKDFEDKNIHGLKYTLKNGRLEPRDPKVIQEREDGEIISVFYDIDNEKDAERAINIINGRIKELNKELEEDLEEWTKEELLEKSEPIGIREIKLCTEQTDFKIVILKIAYEITAKELGKDYLEDEVGKNLAKNLYEVVKGNPLPDKELLKNIQLVQSENGQEAELESWMKITRCHARSQHHLIQFYKFHEKRRQLHCYVNLFGVMEGMVKVSENDNEYINIDELQQKTIINEITGNKNVWCSTHSGIYFGNPEDK